jgi:uncharacterized protein YggT (Ycf19 family)
VTVAYVLDRLISFYTLLIFLYVVLSWFRPSGVLFDVYRTLAMICEPYIGVFRRFMPVGRLGQGYLDFSPFVAILVLQWVIRPGILILLGMLGL